MPCTCKRNIGAPHKINHALKGLSSSSKEDRHVLADALDLLQAEGFKPVSFLSFSQELGWGKGNQDSPVKINGPIRDSRVPRLQQIMEAALEHAEEKPGEE
jgi:hypothetical protein